MSRGQPGEVALLDVVVAPAQQRVDDQRVLDVDEHADRRVDARQLLDREHGVEEAAAGAAVGLGDLDAHDAELEQLPDERARESWRARPSRGPAAGPGPRRTRGRCRGRCARLRRARSAAGWCSTVSCATENLLHGWRKSPNVIIGLLRTLRRRRPVDAALAARRLNHMRAHSRHVSLASPWSRSIAAGGPAGRSTPRIRRRSRRPPQPPAGTAAAGAGARTGAAAADPHRHQLRPRRRHRHRRQGQAGPRPEAGGVHRHRGQQAAEDRAVHRRQDRCDRRRSTRRPTDRDPQRLRRGARGGAARTCGCSCCCWTTTTCGAATTWRSASR